MIKRFLCILLFILIASSGLAIDIRGPGHETRPGFGTDTRGPWAVENDPVICIVIDRTRDNGALGDSSRNGVSVKTGSFRECVNHSPGANTGKVILFEVNGIIDGSFDNYLIDEPNTAIYAQTAPSPGVELKQTTLIVVDSDILIQHLKVRVGGKDSPDSECNNNDAISVQCLASATYENIVLDHVSMAWSTDEISDTGCWEADGTLTDVTVSNSIYSEALADNCHTEGSHSLGAFIGRNAPTNREVNNISLIGNLLIHLAGRVPVFYDNGAFVNNITYNPQWPPSHDLWFSYETANASIVGNMYKKGPDSSANNFGVELISTSGDWAGTPPCTGSQVYINDNITKDCSSDYSTACDGWGDVAQDNTGHGCKAIVEVGSAPIWPSGLIADEATDIEANMSATSGAKAVGAWPAVRDSVDTCLVADMVDGTIGQIVDDEDESGGCGPWPTYSNSSHTLSIPSNPHAVTASGYTNLEVWIHENYTSVAEGRSISIGSTANSKGMIREGVIF